jgi:hypothetical protein
VLVAHEAQVGRRPNVIRRRVHRSGKIIRHDVRRHQFMREAGEHRELVATGGASSGRHHDRGVPGQHGIRFLQRGDPGETGGEAVIGGTGGRRHGRSTL